METIYCAYSTTGNTRSQNQDKLYVNGITDLGQEVKTGIYLSDDIYQLFAVCDGMGGMQCGDEAARMTLNGLMQYPVDQLGTRWKQCISEINRQLCDWQKSEGIQSGCSLAVLLLGGGTAQIVNIGDSRIYLCRDEEIQQLSTDDTLFELLRNSRNRMTASHTLSPQTKNQLLRYLGMEEDEFVLEPHIREVTCKAEDVFLVCSDGVSSVLEPQQMRDTVMLRETVEDMTFELVQTAMNAGSADNMTCIAVQVRSV